MITLVRIGSIPFLMLSFYLNATLTLVVFMFACATDFADGFMAKRFNQTSRFGALLDPVADKLLINTALLLMAGGGQIHGVHLIPAVVTVWRELFISGLREFLAASGKDMHISGLAQYKTAIQMMAITCLFANFCRVLQVAGHILLWASAVLAVISGWQYFRLARPFR
jgi:CDP-diacylglycerol--glycerol-3-phosphate 3-phosphatidyltransferase